MPKKINSRRKGHDLERETAKDMREAGWTRAQRHLEYQTTEANGVDLVNTEPFLVQCKNTSKQPNIPQVMKEIQVENADQIPVVVFNVTNKGKYIAFKYEDALVLMRAFGFVIDHGSRPRSTNPGKAV